MAHHRHWRLAAALVCVALGVHAQSPMDPISVDGFERLQAMRIDTLKLRDPHLFAGISVLCNDVTASLNDSIAEQLDGDADGDGLLDNSPVLLFRPLRLTDRPGLAQAVAGDCTAPVSGTRCQAGGTPALPLPYQSQVIGTCLAPLPGTVRPYSPPVQAALGPCFSADAEGIDLGLGDIGKLLRSPRVAASRRDNPNPGLGNGLLIGFMPESVTDNLLIAVPVLGKVPLSSLLPGGNGNCASHSDRDEHAGESGWWFHINFSASEVPWQESP